MLIDKISGVKKASFAFARKIAPINSVKSFSWDNHELILTKPRVFQLNKYQIGDSKISTNFCFVQTLTQVHAHGLLDTIPQKVKNVLMLKNVFINNTQTTNLTKPKICNTFSNENTNPIINRIDFRLVRPKIAGKVFSKDKSTNSKFKTEKQYNLFSEIEKTETENLRQKTKIERIYTEENKFDPFDVFDIIYPSLQPPLGINFKNSIAFPHPLYDFQIDGIKFLYDSNVALLADDVGLGKSIQTITAARFLFRLGKIKTMCIVCKKALLSDWEKKLWDWAPELKVQKISGPINDRKIKWKIQAHVYIISFQTLLRDFWFTPYNKEIQINEDGHLIKCPNNECSTKIFLEYEKHHKNNQCPDCKKGFHYPENEDLSKTNFDLVVYDEIQEVKNQNSQISHVCKYLFGKYKWGLTATPIENKIDDLLAIYMVLNPNIFKGQYLTKSKISEIISPCFKRRMKENVLKELPEIESENVWLDLSNTQRKKYDLIENQGILTLKENESNISLTNVLALITKLKQICNYDPETNESSKLDFIKNELEGLEETNSKALIFSQYVDTLKKIKPQLEKYQPLIYEGSLSDKARTNMVEAFQNEDRNKVMLLSLKAGNAGITLTRANYVYHFDLWWNPAVLDQAVGRANRIGQKLTVFERVLIINNSIEERIYEILRRKKSLFKDIIGSITDSDFISKSLTEAEIFGLFGLTKEPIKKEITPIVNSENKKLEIDNIDPYEFENIVARIFSKMGYFTIVTQKSNDGGIDVYAKLQTPTGMDNVIIQCKHKRDISSEVGVSSVRELFGVLSADKKISKGFLVTNGRFTKGSWDFALKNNLELIDRAKLLGYIIKYY